MITTPYRFGRCRSYEGEIVSSTLLEVFGQDCFITRAAYQLSTTRKDLLRSECGCMIGDIAVEDIFHTKEGWLPVH